MNALREAEPQGADEPVIPAEFPVRVADDTVNLVAQIRIHHPLKKIARIGLKPFCCEQRIKTGIFFYQRRAGLIQKCLARDVENIRMCSNVGHVTAAFSAGEIADQRVNGVVAVEFGFFERQQIVFFLRSPRLAIRDGEWKLLVNPDGTRLQLYNLTKEPTETDNVLSENPEVAGRMKDMAISWFQALPSAKIPTEVSNTGYENILKVR